MQTTPYGVEFTETSLRERERETERETDTTWRVRSGRGGLAMGIGCVIVSSGVE